MTKILIITNRFIYGGIEKLLLDIFKRKKDDSLQYDLLALTSEKDDSLLEQLEAMGVRYYSLELDKHSKIERQVYHYRKLYSFIKKNQYDVVHINITSYVRTLDMLVVKLAGVKKRIIHSHSADRGLNTLWKTISHLKKLYDYTATVFLACSDEAAKYLFSRKIYESKKYEIIRNGIDVQEYLFSQDNRCRIRNLLRVDSDTILFGHVGRFTKAKNHDFLLEVFNEINHINPNTKMLLVGDGELKNEILKHIRELGIEDKVIMYGSTSNVAELLSAMDVFLFPSRYEGFGMSVIEAECNGLPCYISENIPDTAMLTSNVFKLNIENGAKSWAKTITESNNYRVDEHEKIIEAGFDIESTVDQMERIYKRYDEKEDNKKK